MKAMSYEDTTNWYAKPTLDLAIMDSVYIFDTLLSILEGEVRYEDIADLLSMWYDERRAILDEMKEITITF